MPHLQVFKRKGRVGEGGGGKEKEREIQREGETEAEIKKFREIGSNIKKNVLFGVVERKKKFLQ